MIDKEIEERIDDILCSINIGSKRLAGISHDDIREFARHYIIIGKLIDDKRNNDKLWIQQLQNPYQIGVIMNDAQIKLLSALQDYINFIDDKWCESSDDDDDSVPTDFEVEIEERVNVLFKYIKKGKPNDISKLFSTENSTI